MSKKRKRLRPVVISLITVSLLAGVWFVSHRQPDDGKKPHNGIMAVTVAPVTAKDVVLDLTALGTVTSNHTVTVRSRVDGQLDKVMFEEGQTVRQGQLLAQIDPRPFQAQLTQAEGQLLRDQALLQNARLDLERYRQLLAQNSIAKQQVDTQEALVRQYQGTVKVDHGAVDNARLQLGYSRISAPVSGRVGLRQVDPGNIVHASDTNGLVVITQVQPINVVFAVPETQLTALLEAYRQNPALKVEARNRDNSAKLAEGRLLTVDNQLNTSTGTVSLKARFANADQALFPNQFVNVRLQLGVQQQAPVIPAVAVQQGRGGSYVYAVNRDQKTVSVRQIKTGATQNDDVVVSAGLKPGERVVVDGVDKLREGAKIRVIDPASLDGKAGGKGRHGKRAASAGAAHAASASAN
ncbi:MdtA/MuxA family multidrug efflux RND transporter periplasmic adaptor subunit [Paludibacterium denitrificans]|uniref:MdtA/MuxA family multidrug efflux RND transporter periplasmic adaptor subunit n=1 Tax=Paludibacterium denitrificans TaxID=2675226 RepID=A0A844GE45_9NEIS|nr:MdtA/MuxA family multidrug efflux RND transporter periplasmic adaptor subunit [Paludibacterium denitrificans]MTD33541.1 MdtA/MuxA family multidrug efflux RND transporter periplasmic adaptor subunit [Paludibacterium denitrificans]